MSKLKNKLSKQKNVIRHLYYRNRQLKRQVKDMLEEDRQYTKVTRQKFVTMFTDSEELRFIEKYFKEYPAHVFHRVAEEANYKHGIAKGEPLLERPKVRKMLKRGVGYL